MGCACSKGAKGGKKSKKGSQNNTYFTNLNNDAANNDANNLAVNASNANDRSLLNLPSNATLGELSGSHSQLEVTAFFLF
jgi:hypothetical protein